MPAYTDQLLTEIVYQDGTRVAKVGGAVGGGVNFVTPLTATPNANGNVDLSLADGYSPTLTNLTVTPLTLATLAIPAGSNVDVTLRIIATLATGQVNANLAQSCYRAEVFAGRTGSGGAGANNAKDTSDVLAPFVAFVGGAATTGTANLDVSGNNLLIQVTGFAVKEVWTSGHAYVRGDATTTPGDFVTANGNVYLCVSSGTAGGSAPSGTGTGLGTGALFSYVCAGSTVPVTWSGLYTVQTG